MRQIRLPGYIALKMDSCGSVMIKYLFSNDFDAQTYLALTIDLLEKFIWCHLRCPPPPPCLILKLSKTFFDKKLLHVLLDRGQEFKINNLSTF